MVINLLIATRWCHMAFIAIYFLFKLVYGAIFTKMAPYGAMSAIAWCHVAMSKFIAIYFLFKLVYGAIFTKMVPYGASAIFSAIWR